MAARGKCKVRRRRNRTQMQRFSIRYFTATQDNDYLIVARREFGECEASVSSGARYQFAMPADQMYLG